MSVTGYDTDMGTPIDARNHVAAKNDAMLNVLRTDKKRIIIQNLRYSSEGVKFLETVDDLLGNRDISEKTFTDSITSFFQNVQDMNIKQRKEVIDAIILKIESLHEENRLPLGLSPHWDTIKFKLISLASVTANNNNTERV